MNFYAVRAIYSAELAKVREGFLVSVMAPVLSTALYFLVFGAVLGARIAPANGVGYGSFIVPGLIMMSLMMQAISSTSFGFYFRRFTGTLSEIQAAPVSNLELTLAFVAASVTKSVIIGVIMLLSATLFVPLKISHPFGVLAFFLVTPVIFSLIGLILGCCAKSFEPLNAVQLLIVTPLTFLGGSFYPVSALPDFWQSVSHLNPIFYLISGMRWCFYGQGDVPIILSAGMSIMFLVLAATGLALVYQRGALISE
ncbi:ABC transporter permease [Roseibium sp. RKSG952]|uniref:ABC transporter permease n=1 Tax=Roseibium sp. RKSG952 TaxID=2529384 RepID=UPI0012BBF2EF|nr:ABC transporter permease [Roseibium sp. RKSG952]MTH94957.1 sugar ABC transporter permease [Roseibium sp. RKSG952]